MYIPNSTPAAWAHIRGRGAGGFVHFYPTEGGTIVSADIRGLPNSGFFAFHIHEGSDCTNPGSHYNPQNTPHPSHAGDLPPLLSAGGRAYMTVLTDRFTVADIIGKTAVIHSNPDDFRTQPSGDPGPILACGPIQRV